MGFIKNALKKILINQKEIMEQNRELKKALADNAKEEKAKRYDEIMKHLPNVKIRVARCYPDPQELINGEIHIEYTIATQTIALNPETGAYESVSDIFKAINALNLIPLCDSDMISNIIKEEKEAILKRKKD